VRHPTVIDLFCGAGGFSLGFQAAGCRIVAGVDADETAGQTYRTNFAGLQPLEPPAVLAGDEGNLEEVDLSLLAREGDLDILIGGPPCQGFSRVGRAKLNDLTDEGYAGDARNTLYQRFLDAARFWRPRAVVMENVPGMLSVDGRSVADEAAADLIGCGYRVGYAVLNASWYGVPQFRERLFFVGFRQDLELNPSLPAATHRSELPSGYFRASPELFLPFPGIHHEISIDVAGAAGPATSVAEAIGDLPPITEHLTGGTSAKGDFRKRRRPGRAPDSGFAQRMQRWPGFARPGMPDDHVVRRTPRDYETFARMQPGDRYPEAYAIAQQRFATAVAELGAAAPAHGSAEYAELQRRFVPPYPVDKFRDKWRKLIPGQPSWTVPAHLSKDGYSHIHYDSAQARSISVREAARLQSFPDAFRFTGNMGDCFRQIGNAVPPLLSWAIAHHVVTRLELFARAPSLSGAACAADEEASETGEFRAETESL